LYSPEKILFLENSPEWRKMILGMIADYLQVLMAENVQVYDLLPETQLQQKP